MYILAYKNFNVNKKGKTMALNSQTDKPTEKKSLPSKAMAIAGVVIILIVLILRVVLRSEEDRQIFFCMDTTVTIKSYGGNSKEYKGIVLRLDKLFDCHNKDSEISKLNEKGELKPSKDTLKLLEEAKAFCEDNSEIDITSGRLIDLWDISGGGNIPGEEQIKACLSDMGIENLEIQKDSVSLKSGKIDLGCVAKGYACDVLKKQFEKNGEECAIATFGSSSVLYGKKPDGEKFTVGVTNPEKKGESLGVLNLGECFVSTSGGYERFFEKDGKRYSHIMDLTTGKPVETDILSVTVIGQGGAFTDLMSSLVYIKGSKCLEEISGRDDLQVVAVVGKDIYISKALKGAFELENKEYSVIYI